MFATQPSKLRRLKRAPLAHRSVKGMLTALLIAAALLIANVESAYAASEIGEYRPAQVWCDAGANTIHISPLVGAGDKYSSQTIRYRFWAVDVEKNQSFWLGGSYWRTFLAQRVGEPYQDILGNWYPGQVTPIVNGPTEGWIVNGITVPGGNHRFYVYAQYQWYSPTYGGYVGNATLRTNVYNNTNSASSYYTGSAAAYYCLL